MAQDHKSKYNNAVIINASGKIVKISEKLSEGSDIANSEQTFSLSVVNVFSIHFSILKYFIELNVVWMPK